MPLYQYQAFDQAGVLRKGSEDAVSESDLRQRLRSPTLSQGNSGSRNTVVPSSKTWNQLQASMTLFTRQFEVLMDATIPYDKALQLITGRLKTWDLKKSWPKSEHVLLKGDLWRMRWLYPKIFLSVCQHDSLGENSGNLGTILKRLADYYETQERLRGRLKSAMIYLRLVFRCWWLSLWSLTSTPRSPRFLPANPATPTHQNFDGLSDFMVNSWYLVLIGLVILIFGFSAFLRGEFGKKVLQQRN